MKKEQDSTQTINKFRPPRTPDFRIIKQLWMKCLKKQKDKITLMWQVKRDCYKIDLGVYEKEFKTH